jgi:hypothetical protein
MPQAALPSAGGSAAASAGGRGLCPPLRKRFMDLPCQGQTTASTGFGMDGSGPSNRFVRPSLAGERKTSLATPGVEIPHGKVAD